MKKLVDFHQRYLYYNTCTGHLAQLGEHLFDVQKVGGSIPSVPTIKKITPQLRCFFIDFCIKKELEFELLLVK